MVDAAGPRLRAPACAQDLLLCVDHVLQAITRPPARTSGGGAAPVHGARRETSTRGVVNAGAAHAVWADKRHVVAAARAAWFEAAAGAPLGLRHEYVPRPHPVTHGRTPGSMHGAWPAGHSCAAERLNGKDRYQRPWCTMWRRARTRAETGTVCVSGPAADHPARPPLGGLGLRQPPLPWDPATYPSCDRVGQVVPESAP